MINSLLRSILKVVFFLIRWIFNILLLPLKPIMAIFPTFDNFLETAVNFIDNYVLRAIAFAKQVFLNITGFPQELITISVNFALAMLTYIMILRMIVFVSSIYKKFKGGTE